MKKLMSPPGKRGMAMMTIRAVELAGALTAIGALSVFPCMGVWRQHAIAKASVSLIIMVFMALEVGLGGDVFCIAQYGT